MTLVEEMVEELSLPGRAEAETAICRMMREGRPGFVLAVLAKDVASINEQYGYRAGDRVLGELAHRLANGMGPSRKLFRWSATSFLIVSDSLQKSIRSSFPGASTAVFGVWPQDPPRGLFDRIDNYIASSLACYEAA